jgi:hypothetical protein
MSIILYLYTLYLKSMLKTKTNLQWLQIYALGEGISHPHAPTSNLFLSENLFIIIRSFKESVPHI